MELVWIDRHHLDESEVDCAAALLAAAQAVDSPEAAPFSRASLVTDIRFGWDGDPSQVGVLHDKRGRATGLVVVGYSSWDNAHLGFVEVTVDPTARRQGIGRRLLETGIEAVRATGKTVVLTQSHDSPAPTALGAALGFERAMSEVQRRQDVVTLDWPRLDRDHDEATAAASAYDVLRVAGPTPEDLLSDVAQISAAINDAPTGELDVEDEVFTTERVRAFEHGQRERRGRLYRVLARERASGELAGHTLVAVDIDHPGFGNQLDTSVARAHRGHRLGLLLKLEMLRWLSDAEPQLRVLDTWNADDNAHMIDVNERLGYRVVRVGVEWQKRLDTDVR